MERSILVCGAPSAGGGAAADWAEDEARLRGLPLRVDHGGQPDLNGARTAVMAVTGLSPEDAVAGRMPGAALPTRAGTWTCPLVMVRDGLARPSRGGGVTLGVDARDPADAAIGFAFDSARLRGVRLHVVHAWALPSCAAELPFGVPEADRATWEDHEVQLLADVLRPWRAKYPDVPVLEDVVLFGPSHALLHHAADAALVVVGHRPGAEWGDVVRSLVRDGSCPVAVVPS
ncbi:universal stress protein [Streptomyces sp. NPDC086549]|uniref:universal stress protein n=1 Tax=Streptomyces sp. NPDC086549 TaxID=3365752 RepID=UPI00382E0F6D